MSETKYFKTVVQVTILSEFQYSNEDLADIAYDITEGECSGQVETISQVELSPKEAAEALMAQGSEPSFFGLNEDGSSSDDEDDED